MPAMARIFSARVRRQRLMEDLGDDAGPALELEDRALAALPELRPEAAAAGRSCVDDLRARRRHARSPRGQDQRLVVVGALVDGAGPTDSRRARATARHRRPTPPTCAPRGTCCRRTARARSCVALCSTRFSRPSVNSAISVDRLGGVPRSPSPRAAPSEVMKFVVLANSPCCGQKTCRQPCPRRRSQSRRRRSAGRPRRFAADHRRQQGARIVAHRRAGLPRLQLQAIDEAGDPALRQRRPIASTVPPCSK